MEQAVSLKNYTKIEVTGPNTSISLALKEAGLL